MIQARPPREVDLTVVGCKCDHCGISLDKLNRIWVWNEHFACSRDHVQRAQAQTNREDSVEEKDTDLL
jgi:hypothetical protein